MSTALGARPPTESRGAKRDAATSARLLTPDELAERWSVSKAHIYRLAREHQIPTVSIGRYYRFRLPAIEAWELAQEGPSDG